MNQGFVPREVLILEFVHHILSTPQNLKVEIDVLWSTIFDLLNLLLTNSKQPFSFLWFLSILQELDQRQPSRETCFSERRNRRNVTELSRTICSISAKHFHLHVNAPFDLSPPLPPISSTLLRKLEEGVRLHFAQSYGLPLSSTSSAPRLFVPSLFVPSFQDADCPEVDRTLKNFVSEERDPIDIVSQHAIASMIGFCNQLGVTQRRTAVAAEALQVFVEEGLRIVLPVALRSSNLEVIR